MYAPKETRNQKGSWETRSERLDWRVQVEDGKEEGGERGRPGVTYDGDDLLLDDLGQWHELEEEREVELSRGNGTVRTRTI